MVSVTDWRPAWLPWDDPARDDPLGTPNQVLIPSPTSSVPTLDTESLWKHTERSTQREHKRSLIIRYQATMRTQARLSQGV